MRANSPPEHADAPNSEAQPRDEEADLPWLGLWDEKPFMAILPGESVELRADESQALKDQTDPTWPHVWAKLEGSFEEFLNVFPCNHAQGCRATACAS
ncbi:MAG: hypothetical protein R6X33_10720 [Candidatus Brocadiia bacterium]